MMTKTKLPKLTITSEYYSPQCAQTSTPCFEDEQIEQDMPTLDLALSFAAIDEEIIFQNNGYQKIEKICNTLQGELFKATKISNNKIVAIKKTDKTLFQQRIAIQDDINFCVSENIIKESLILQYLTYDNTPIGGYIVKSLDFFESVTNIYLVMEYIETQTNLKQFASISHQYIQNGKLSKKEYHKMLQYLMWQLFVTIQWLHISMHCCHLDICTENILVTNANFIPTKHGVSIDPNISIKICDFGVSERFKTTDSFLCEKQGLSLENELYFAPNVFNGDIYDARCADNWLLGMILFECITGRQLYGPKDIYIESIKSAYWALHHNKLKKHLAINDILKFFNVDSFNLVNGLLNVDENLRLKGMNILRHKWFKMYFKRYNHQISKKFKEPHKIQMTEYDRFPFYH